MATLAWPYTLSSQSLRNVYERPSGPGAAIQSLLGDSSGRSYALLIGIGDYEGGWDPLAAPFRDVLRMKAYLGNEAGFDTIVTLTDAQASRENIEYFMEEFFPQRVRAEDRFVLYFSGHGTQRTLPSGRIRGYLPLATSGKTQWSTMLSMTELERWSENLAHARHVLFLLDSCFSGLAGIEVKGNLERLYRNTLLQRGHHLLTAGAADQVSLASLSRWGGSLFTTAFLDGVRGAADASFPDFPADGIVSLTEIKAYIDQRLRQEEALDAKARQTPLLADLLPGGSKGQFFFVKTSSHPRPTPTRGGESGTHEVKGRKAETPIPDLLSLEGWGTLIVRVFPSGEVHARCGGGLSFDLRPSTPASVPVGTCELRVTNPRFDRTFTETVEVAPGTTMRKTFSFPTDPGEILAPETPPS